MRGPLLITWPEVPCERFNNQSTPSLVRACLPVPGHDRATWCLQSNCNSFTYQQTLLATQVKLDLAAKVQSTIPPGLKPYVQRVHVRATSYKQLKRLGDRLSGISSASALELELSFGREDALDLGTVKSFFCHAGLAERVRAVKYRCRAVYGTSLFPGIETPISAELWPGYMGCQPFWRNVFQHSLVNLHITVHKPEHALHSIKAALRCEDHICGTLRCLQVDCLSEDWQYSLPLSAITGFLAGLKLPSLRHLGSDAGVRDCFRVFSSAYPQKEDMPQLISFGGNTEPDGIFGLGREGVHVFFGGPQHFANMGPLATSALGAGIRELHITIDDIEKTWEGILTSKPPHSVLDFLTMLPCLQELSITAWTGQVLVKAEAINAITRLETLALRDVAIKGYLTNPHLTQLVCLSAGTQLMNVLARPPPALASIVVPYHTHSTWCPQVVLGISISSKTDVVRARRGGPHWKVSSEPCMLWDSHKNSAIDRLLKVVRC